MTKKKKQLMKEKKEAGKKCMLERLSSHKSRPVCVEPYFSVGLSAHRHDDLKHHHNGRRQELQGLQALYYAHK